MDHRRVYPVSPNPSEAKSEAKSETKSDIENGDANKDKPVSIFEVDGINGVKKHRKPFPGFRKNFYSYFSEYSNNTGIHGFKYIMGDSDMTIFERLWWLALFCVSLTICILLIMQTWTKWEQSPVLVSFARSPTPVWQIPFPAITICSENKARQSVYNFTEYYHKVLENKNMTSEEQKKFSDMALVCDNHLYNGGKETTDYSSLDFLMGIGSDFDEILWQCKWTLQNESCHNLFTQTLTEDGACYTFNMLNRTEIYTKKVYFPEKYNNETKGSDGWTLEGGYPDGEINTFPRRAMSAGANAGLFLVLRAFESDLDYLCRGPVQGFKILLHNPAETPRVGTQYFRAPLNQEVVVSVKPDMMTTSDGLKGYEAHRRQCYFPHERKLSFFNLYTQQHCEIECLTNYTLKKCDCVAYHMPHEENTPMCGSKSLQCMFHAQNELLEKNVRSGLRSPDESQDPDTCDCLPSCTSLVYNAESSQATYNWPAMFVAFKANFSEFPNGLALSRVTIFFKEQQFITSERNELYGQTDFLANCGGILGLFTGFSFLSMVEIIYFLTLKMMCNVKKYGRHYWSGAPELINDKGYVHPK